MKVPLFDWDKDNLRKIRAHRVRRDQVEQALVEWPDLDLWIGGWRRIAVCLLWRAGFRAAVSHCFDWARGSDSGGNRVWSGRRTKERLSRTAVARGV